MLDGKNITLDVEKALEKKCMRLPNKLGKENGWVTLVSVLLIL